MTTWGRLARAMAWVTMSMPPTMTAAFRPIPAPSVFVSSTLFDTVAVYLAISEQPFEMQDLPLTVTDDGFTIIDRENGRSVRCAMEWKDLNAFEKRLTDILLGA